LLDLQFQVNKKKFFIRSIALLLVLAFTGTSSIPYGFTLPQESNAKTPSLAAARLVENSPSLRSELRELLGLDAAREIAAQPPLTHTHASPFQVDAASTDSRQMRSEVRTKGQVKKRLILLTLGLGLAGIGVVIWQPAVRTKVASVFSHRKPWYKHVSSPTLQGIQGDLEVAADWLRDRHYPDMKIIDAYLKNFASAEPTSEPLFLATKMVDNQTILNLVNINGAHTLFESIRETQSEDMFVEEWVSMLVSASWEAALARDPIFPLRDIDKKSITVYTQLNDKISQVDQNDATALLNLLVREKETYEKKLMIPILAVAEFSSVHQFEFLEWAESNGFYSPKIVQEQVGKGSVNPNLAALSEKVRSDYEKPYQIRGILADYLSGIYYILPYREKDWLGYVYENYLPYAQAAYQTSSGKDGISPEVVDLLRKGVRPSPNDFIHIAETLYLAVDQEINRLTDEIRSRNELRTRLAKMKWQRWSQMLAFMFPLAGFVGCSSVPTMKGMEERRELYSQKILNYDPTIRNDAYQLFQDSAFKVFDDYDSTLYNLAAGKNMPENVSHTDGKWNKPIDFDYSGFLGELFPEKGRAFPTVGSDAPTDSWYDYWDRLHHVYFKGPKFARELQVLERMDPKTLKDYAVMVSKAADRASNRWAGDESTKIEENLRLIELVQRSTTLKLLFESGRLSLPQKQTIHFKWSMRSPVTVTFPSIYWNAEDIPRLRALAAGEEPFYSPMLS